MDINNINSIATKEETLNSIKKNRKKFIRYKEAEVIYSLQHKKLLQLADEAGAIYRIDGYVLINRDIFDEYFEKFHQKAGTYSVSTKERSE